MTLNFLRKRFSSFFLFFLPFLFFTLFVPIKAQASQNFLVSFDVTYTVSESGITHAVFNGILQNTSSAYYASSYTLQTGFYSIKNLHAYDSNGVINPQIVPSDSGNSVKLQFNTKAVGNNAVLPFSFSFDTENVAKKVGNIWEINIPGIANASDFKNFTIHLKVPQSFGLPSYIKPVSSSSSLDFSKDVLGSSGISLAFGNSQTYNFTLKYHLKDAELFPVESEIDIPASTNYQDVAITSITPKPNSVSIDPDGNWLAKYSLLPSQSIEVVVAGTSTLNLSPKEEDLPLAKRKLYLQADPNWQQSSNIKTLAKELVTPQNIYDYVVNHLHYDFSRVVGIQERLGAEKVLQNPQSAVCLEFTDLFIALSRAAGIPAREVNGFAYTQNAKERPLSLVKDVLHAWPEYYDDSRKTWIMIDPTWANTTRGVDYFNTLDFDHFAFVIKGISSQYPVPAGGYKLSGDEKDVFVSFGQNTGESVPTISVDFSTPSFVLSGHSYSANLIIKNVGDSLVSPQYITVNASKLSPHEQVIVSPPIPPYGTVEIPVSFKKTSFLTFFSETITIHVGEKTVSKKITVYPFFLQTQIIVGGIIFVVFCIIIFVFAAKFRRLQIPKQKQGSSLRGQGKEFKK